MAYVIIIPITIVNSVLNPILCILNEKSYGIFTLSQIAVAITNALYNRVKNNGNIYIIHIKINLLS